MIVNNATMNLHYSESNLIKTTVIVMIGTTDKNNHCIMGSHANV
jgi:hypothetical protein